VRERRSRSAATTDSGLDGERGYGAAAPRFRLRGSTTYYDVADRGSQKNMNIYSFS